MYFVYVLESLNLKKFYKGMTKDVNRRLYEHLSGKVSVTKHMLPLKLIHVEVCGDSKEAREIEKYFKSGFGREILAEVAKLVDAHA